MDPSLVSLARSTTRAGSPQTYLTIRWLVDRDLTDDAFLAYAYFRWLDDRLDSEDVPRLERLRLLADQRELLDHARRGQAGRPGCPEEQWLVELVRRDRPDHPGLRSYLDGMMAIMRFDADRRGRTIRADELAGYSRGLSHAVMDGLSYFVGHRVRYPPSATRALAAYGAHIVHMIRDAAEDVAVGYFNVPREFLAAHRVSPFDVSGAGYRLWMLERLALARRCFELGRRYIARLGSLRVRLAGYAYCTRFETTKIRLERAPHSSLAETSTWLFPGAVDVRARDGVTGPGLPGRQADESA